jgi:hypothetical protein
MSGCFIQNCTQTGFVPTPDRLQPGVTRNIVLRKFNAPRVCRRILPTTKVSFKG